MTFDATTTRETATTCPPPAWASELLDACKFLLSPSDIEEAMDRIREVVERVE